MCREALNGGIPTPLRGLTTIGTPDPAHEESIKGESNSHSAVAICTSGLQMQIYKNNDLRRPTTRVCFSQSVAVLCGTSFLGRET